MRRRTIVLLQIGFLAAGFQLVAQDAAGQNANLREGFWLSGGLGYGTLGCQDCSGREGGLSGNLAIGGTISQKVILGAATHGWTKSEGGATLTAGTLTAVIRFYPSATGGFFLLGGLGFGSLDLGISGLGNVRETGTGAVLGLGYDIRVGRMVSLTPYWNGIGIALSNGGDANVSQIGLGVTVH